MKHRWAIACPALIWTCFLVFSTVAMTILTSGTINAQEATPSKRDEIVLLAFGDSLTAGYRIPPDKAFPAQLEAALRAKGYGVRVQNSGVSGDTVADGLARLDWSLSEKVDGAIVEFGANDALRGFDPKRTEHDLDAMLKALQAKNIELLLAGMEAPRNWGQDYDDAFRAIYPKLAGEYNAILYPFFLKDVATVRSLNLSDGLHPTPDGVAVIVKNILPDVEKLIARVREKRSAKPS